MLCACANASEQDVLRAMKQRIGTDAIVVDAEFMVKIHDDLDTSVMRKKRCGQCIQAISDLVLGFLPWLGQERPVRVFSYAELQAEFKSYRKSLHTEDDISDDQLALGFEL